MYETFNIQPIISICFSSRISRFFWVALWCRGLGMYGTLSRLGREKPGTSANQRPRISRLKTTAQKPCRFFPEIWACLDFLALFTNSGNEMHAEPWSIFVACQTLVFLSVHVSSVVLMFQVSRQAKFFCAVGFLFFGCYFSCVFVKGMQAFTLKRHISRSFFSTKTGTMQNDCLNKIFDKNNV